VLSGDGCWLFAVNAGSDDLSVLAVDADGWPWSTAPRRWTGPRVG
jgi:hypothetical protein